MGLTLGLTFMTSSLRCLHRAGRGLGCYFSIGLAVAVDDASAREVVGAELHDHAVFRDDADVVLPHLARNRGEDLVSVAELNAEHRVGQRLGDHAFDLDDTVFLRHTLANTCADRSICGGWGFWCLDTPIQAKRTKEQAYVIKDAAASATATQYMAFADRVEYSVPCEARSRIEIGWMFSVMEPSSTRPWIV